MLIVNLLNGVFLASLVCFVVGIVLLAIQAGRSSGPDATASPPNATRVQKYQAQLRAAFADPRFRIGRTLIVAGAVAAVASTIVVFVLSASLPRCPIVPGGSDEAVALCMPAARAPAA